MASCSDLRSGSEMSIGSPEPPLVGLAALARILPPDLRYRNSRNSNTLDTLIDSRLTEISLPAMNGAPTDDAQAQSSSMRVNVCERGYCTLLFIVDQRVRASGR